MNPNQNPKSFLQKLQKQNKDLSEQIQEIQKNIELKEKLKELTEKNDTVDAQRIKHTKNGIYVPNAWKNSDKIQQVKAIHIPPQPEPLIQVIMNTSSVTNKNDKNDKNENDEHVNIKDDDNEHEHKHEHKHYHEHEDEDEDEHEHEHEHEDEDEDDQYIKTFDKNICKICTQYKQSDKLLCSECHFNGMCGFLYKCTNNKCKRKHICNSDDCLNIIKSNPNYDKYDETNHNSPYYKWCTSCSVNYMKN